MSIPYQLVPEYLDIGPGDILLEIGGNTGKITEASSANCKEIVVLVPKRNIVEYEKSHRPLLYLLKVMPLLLNNTN